MLAELKRIRRLILGRNRILVKAQTEARSNQEEKEEALDITENPPRDEFAPCVKCQARHLDGENKWILPHPRGL